MLTYPTPAQLPLPEPSYEEWRPVVGYEEWYEVSSLGRVRRLKAAKGTRVGRLCTPSFNVGREEQERGYFIITLLISGRRVTKTLASLVAAAFIGPRPKGLEINHINGNKLDNVAWNLEYVTKQRNIRHAVEMGLICRGQDKPEAKLTDNDVREIRSWKGLKSHVELARRFDISEQVISEIQLGRAWRHVV